MGEEEKLIGEFHNVKHNKQAGVLILTSLRVAWAPGEIVERFQVDHPYPHIKAQRISAETSSKVQLQLILHSGSPVKFHFTAPNALEQRGQAKEHLVRLLTNSLSPELEAKNNLLKSNASLYQLYKDLVTTGILSADEFWANQATGSQVSTHSQEGGLPSAFLADVQAVYDGCNAVRYNLSTDAMQAIFKTYPSVKRKHAEMVPDQMEEKEFWTKFFQSQFFHQDSNKTSTFHEDFSDDKHLSKASNNRVILNTSETTSNILGEEGYSLTPECQTLKTPHPLIQRCNHHSNRVLQALQEGSSSVSHPTLPPAPSSSQPLLHISPSHLTTSSTPHSTSLLLLAHTLSSWQLQQEVDPLNAHSALAHLSPGGMLMPGGCGQKGTTLLTEEQQQHMFRHQAAVSELLRHFWSCFPARTTQLEAKAHKMHQSLVDYSQNQLKEMLQLFDATDSLGIIQHINDSISKANQHYLKWVSKKKSLPHRT